MLTFSRAFVFVLLLTTTVTVLGYGSNSSSLDFPPSFNITKPSGNVTWFVGQTVNVTWTNVSDVSAQYTADDGYGCAVSLFRISDQSSPIVFISPLTVFATGYVSWTVPASLVSDVAYVVGVGYRNYVISDAAILISTPNVTSSESSMATPTSLSTTSSSSSILNQPISNQQIPNQQTQTNTSPTQFSSVGGVPGLIGIVTCGTLVLGGILGIMVYNSCRERKGHLPAMGQASHYGGEGSSYVPKSDETFSYANDYEGTKATLATSPPTSPNLGATNASTTSHSTYTPFSKRNPNPHHDNVDLLQVDPFAKPVPAYILTSDLTEHPADRQQRGAKGRRPSEPEESRPYNFI